MKIRNVELGQFTRAIALIRERFPDLEVRVLEATGDLDASADIKKQVGLSFDVHINLQNYDELHLCAGQLWVEWFPCGDEAVFKTFTESMEGLLGGEYRIVERYIGSSAVSASLQRPLGDKWQSVADWANLRALIPWPRRVRVLRNIRAA